MGEVRKVKRSAIRTILTVLLAVVILAGCGHRGPVLVDFPYKPAAGAVPAGTAKAAVAVTPFKDERGRTESVAGKHINAVNDDISNLVVQGTVADKVAGAFRTALRIRNVAVIENASWDQTEAGIPQQGSLILSGQIKDLWVESISAFGSTKVSAKVALRVIAADPAQKKIVRALNVNSSIERQNVVYSTAFVQETMAEALSAAINQALNDEELKKRLE